MQRIYGFSILLQRYVTKGNDAKNPAFLAFVVTERQDFFCRFLAIQSLEFQEIWEKNKIREHVNDLSRKI